jgi:energy-coupling factor transport system ATP-binding protein|uniref:ABC transporter ATP-binding protein n=1 Tax=candidate division WOR-3 bacterium TaxID=2052148 RepID=A0A7C4Y4D7_UNCW3
MITLKMVNYSQGEKKILKNINLEFEERKVHLIIGTTGSGKTTLLSIIMGFLNPESGEISVPRGDIRRLRENMGMVFQFPEDMFFTDTVYDELTIPIRKRRLKNTEEIVSEILSSLGLEKDILSKSPYHLSYGEKRLVAIGSVLSSSPEWILLDEVFAGLDWEYEKKIVKIIENLKGGKSIIIVTHRIDSIIRYADTVTLLHNGEVVFSLPVEKVNWKEVYDKGCDVPNTVKFAFKLHEKGINIGQPLSIQELIKNLKEYIWGK